MGEQGAGVGARLIDGWDWRDGGVWVRFAHRAARVAEPIGAGSVASAMPTSMRLQGRHL